ncbi:MAG: aminomethyl-transferring glycine dehydrogenase subunit GcvPA [Tissierellia bacterium]|nr:aminomethyl-transferring glycine dehydrogenase subunit GcvPA [Tissierellia bacterium]
MAQYIPHTPEDIAEMLSFLGLNNEEELFSDIPENLKLKGGLKLSEGKTEGEVMDYLLKLQDNCFSTDEYISFLGAGAYDHRIPVVIDSIISRGEYLTSYTPYQPEVSQGTLQYIFEFQTMLNNLTGMDVANASVYDVGSGAAEALLMATGVARKKKVLVSEAINHSTKEVLLTYLPLHGIEIQWISASEGTTDLKELEESMGDDVGAVFLQSPNFYGIIEDVEAASKIAHSVKKAAMVLAADPISLGILKRPGDMGVDIYIGEGQCLGIPQTYGGPYLGLMAAKEQYMRKMPGRIVGETVDSNGERAFVLTLTAREQHIRREKATSNICSNQGLNVLAATIYLVMMGPEGLRDVAYQCMQKAHYAKEAMEATGKVKLKFDKPFFKEFVMVHEEPVELWQERAAEAGYFAGVPMGYFYDEMQDAVMYAVTEKRTREEIDGLCELLEVQL